METHPFGNFIPQKSQYLLLGSFAARAAEGYDWFYGNKRNQLWPIMEEVYGVKLDTKARRQRLFQRLGMAVTDIILSCERKNNSNLDTNLTNIVYNTKAVKSILQKNKIKAIFFSSRFAERLFRRQFKDVIQQFPQTKLVILPSPSPRYAVMSIVEKISWYKELLPELN